VFELLARLWRGIKRALGIGPTALPPPTPKEHVDYEGTPYVSPYGGQPYAPSADVGTAKPKPKPQVSAQQLAEAKPKPVDPYDAGDLLELSPGELRAKALTIVPWKTAWIGRVDVIPPQSDERTALVDRGLILRGYFTKEELDEIHEVGDAWLAHTEAAKLAKARAAKTVDEALKRMREEEARRKQEKRRLAAEAKKQRAEEIAKRKRTDIVFLGRGVSAGLADRRAHVEKLRERGLPVLATPADVAKALEVTVPQLRWLAFHQEAARSTHYVQFEVPKRSGGTRLLASPKKHLRAAQEWIRAEILEKVQLHEAAHGFVPGRSTVTCARPHQGRGMVVNLDLEDFFPSVTVHRVRGIFAELGYSPAASTILALLCTESPRRRARYAGTSYEVALGAPCLPQGACTSPALSNLVARRLDARLSGYAKKNGWVYTRYADDLSFSADGKKDLGRFLAKVRHIVEDEGFRVNRKKTRVQRSGGRQQVTGIVVNRSGKLTLPRAEVRRLRAILHQAKKTGLAAQNRDAHPDFEAHLRGKIAYVAMVDPARGAKLKAALDAVV